MQDYVSGILEVNETVEAYHSIPFRRRLVLRTLVGKEIEISDPEAIANDLRVGKTYKMIIVVAGVERVRAFTHSRTMSARFSGTIRQLKWEPQPDSYQLANEDYLKQPMSIVGTVSGNVLISRMLLGGVSVGNAVTWGKDEFNLVAVYR